MAITRNLKLRHRSGADVARHILCHTKLTLPRILVQMIERRQTCVTNNGIRLCYRE